MNRQEAAVQLVEVAEVGMIGTGECAILIGLAAENGAAHVGKFRGGGSIDGLLELRRAQ